MEQNYCVKGSSIRTKINFARQNWGSEAEQEITRRLEQKGLTSLLDNNWYPYQIYDDLLLHISRTHYQGDNARLAQIGEFSAEEAFSATYKAYAVGNFLSVFSKLALLHGRFYNLGQMEVSVDESAYHAKIRLHGAPYYSEADLQVARGFYLGLAQRMKLSGVTCEFHLQGKEALFDINWQ